MKCSNLETCITLCDKSRSENRHLVVLFSATDTACQVLNRTVQPENSFRDELYDCLLSAIINVHFQSLSSAGSNVLMNQYQPLCCQLGRHESAHRWTGTTVTCQAASLDCSEWSRERDACEGAADLGGRWTLAAEPGHDSGFAMRYSSSR